jgi:hypothetical protein
MFLGDMLVACWAPPMGGTRLWPAQGVPPWCPLGAPLVLPFHPSCGTCSMGVLVFPPPPHPLPWPIKGGEGAAILLILGSHTHAMLC